MVTVVVAVLGVLLEVELVLVLVFADEEVLRVVSPRVAVTVAVAAAG